MMIVARNCGRRSPRKKMRKMVTALAMMIWKMGLLLGLKLDVSATLELAGV